MCGKNTFATSMPTHYVLEVHEMTCAGDLTAQTVYFLIPVFSLLVNSGSYLICFQEIDFLPELSSVSFDYSYPKIPAAYKLVSENEL